MKKWSEDDRMAQQTPDGTDAVVITVKGYPERGIVKFYNHMCNLTFFPKGSDSMIGDQELVESDKDRKDYVYGSSYPINTAYIIAGKINSGAK